MEHIELKEIVFPAFDEAKKVFELADSKQHRVKVSGCIIVAYIGKARSYVDRRVPKLMGFYHGMPSPHYNYSEAAYKKICVYLNKLRLEYIRGLCNE